MITDTQELDMLIPNSPLLLYAKNWIRFRKKYTPGLMEDMKDIVSLCNYVPCEKPVLQVVMLFDGIVKYYQEMSEKCPELKIVVTKDMTNIYRFMSRVYDRMMINTAISSYVSHDHAIVESILSMLAGLPIAPPMKIRRVEYSKHTKICMGLNQNGLTFKQMQDDFDHAFGGCFLTKDKRQLKKTL